MLLLTRWSRLRPLRARKRRTNSLRTPSQSESNLPDSNSSSITVRPGRRSPAPMVVVAAAPQALAKSAHSRRDHPHCRAARKPAVKASPAPVVSTTSTRNGGTPHSLPLSRTRHPSPPSLSTTSRAHACSIAANAPSAEGCPVSASASMALANTVSTSRAACMILSGISRLGPVPTSTATQIPRAFALAMSWPAHSELDGVRNAYPAISSAVTPSSQAWRRSVTRSSPQAPRLPKKVRCPFGLMVMNISPVIARGLRCTCETSIFSRAARARTISANQSLPTEFSSRVGHPRRASTMATFSPTPPHWKESSGERQSSPSAGGAASGAVISTLMSPTTRIMPVASCISVREEIATKGTAP